VSDERSLIELAAAIGGFTGVAASRIEEQVRPASRVLSWKASIPAFIAAGLLYTVKARKLAAGLAAFGAGVVANDAIGLLMQSGTPWERKDIFLRGTQRNIKLPSWTNGRTLEECMVEPYLIDAAWRGRISPEVRADVFRVLDAKKLDGRDYLNVVEALQQDQIQNIKYAHDPVRTEIFQEAPVTLKLKRGDCDDHAVLMASKLMSVGIPAKLLILSFDPDYQPNKSRYGHILCVANVKGKDYWVETIQQDPPASFDFRPAHTGRIEYNLVSPSDTKKKTVSNVAVDSIAGLADLSYADQDLTLGIV